MADGHVLFTFRLIPLFSRIASARSIDLAPLVQQAGLPPEALVGEITAPLGRIRDFVEAVATALDAPMFGLDLAKLVPPGAYGVVEFVVRAAPSIEAALAVLAELTPLINPIGEFRFLEEPDGRGRLSYRVARQRDTLGCHLNEFSIAYLIEQFGKVLGRPLVVERIGFSHARPKHAADVAKRLGCEVAFQGPDCSFTVSREELASVPLTADPALFEFLSAQARGQLARLGPGDIVSRVIHVIESRMPGGDLSAAAIAKAMATTVRSLQRYLTDAGTSYRDVLLHVRQVRRAELSHGGVGDPEIARELGFSDVRSMRRALDEA